MTEGFLSLFLNILLFTVKFAVGLATGSIALIADAWHTLSDSLTSIIVLVGGKIASKPADQEHPFGHGRAELIASLIIGIILALVGFNFLIESIDRLRSHESVHYGLWALLVTILSVVTKEAMAQYAFYAYRKSGSQSLKADAWHHRTDAISSVLILVGIIFGGAYWWMDGVLGLGVSVLIFYTAYEIVIEATNPLLGEKPDVQIISKVDQIIKQSAPYNLAQHHLQMHTYGSHKEITFHVQFPPETKISEAHDIVTEIEEKIYNELKISATIHMEPYSKAGHDLNLFSYPIKS